MDTAVVMVQPLKRPPVQQAPPGIPPTTFRNTTQSQMSGLTPSQQAQAIANPQQQAILANDGRPAGHQQSNPAAPLHHQKPTNREEPGGQVSQRHDDQGHSDVNLPRASRASLKEVRNRKETESGLPRASENVKATLTKQIVAFVESRDKQLTFPSSLTTCQRKIIHELAEAAGLHHESHGRNQRRRITVINKNYQPAPTQPDPIVTFSLKLTLDKEHNLADLIPSVTIPDSDPFNISFHLVKHDMVLGNISFTNLHTLALPVSLPVVENSVRVLPLDQFRIEVKISDTKTMIANRHFMLPQTSGIYCTSVNLEAPGNSSPEEDLFAGTQPPAFKISMNVAYTHFNFSPPPLLPTSNSNPGCSISSHRPRNVEPPAPEKGTSLDSVIIFFSI